jgi:hypothetical protein
MTEIQLWRLHTEALDEATLRGIADHIITCYPRQKVYVYPIERDSSEIDEIYENVHQPDCECGACTGEDRAIAQMEKGIVEAERNYGDD